MNNWLTKKYRLSINRSLINKNDLNDIEAFAADFENVEYTLQELADSIKNGFAYSAELYGSRKTANFAASGILSVNLDGTMDGKEIYYHPLFQKYGSIFYTTPSFSKGRQHYRLIFALERPIDCKIDMRAATRSLALQFYGDANVEDPSRLFYGNKKAKLRIWDRGIPNAFLEELIKQGKNALTIDPVTHDYATGSTVGLIMTHGLIRDNDDNAKPLSEYKAGTKVYCAKHKDDKPVATVTNKNGTNGIYCKTCNNTFWPDKTNLDYDFNSFAKAARNFSEFNEEHKDNGQLYMFENTIKGMKEANIHFREEEYLSDFRIKSDLTFIKSPKGTGKSVFLKNHLPIINKKVLLIGHRRSLIKDAANKLELKCYLDYSKEDKSRLNFDRYAISLDSLPRIPNDIKYDTILLDESEQILAHFLSNTLADKRRNIFHKFKHIIFKAKHVVALDADLSWPSYYFLSEWKNKNKENSVADLIINNWNKEKGEISIIASKNQIIGDITASIQNGEKIYVACNSKTQVNNINNSLDKDFINSDEVIVVTSETVSEEHVQKFLTNPSVEALKYRVILASPSISSGVDISFENNAKLFDCVYGIFDPLILTHFECDQQLARVRHPKKIKVFISGRRFNFESNLEVIKNNILSSSLMDHLVIGYDENGPIFEETDELLKVASLIISQQRASKNNLRDNFINLKQSEGWTIKYAKDDQFFKTIGSQKQFAGKSKTKKLYNEALMNARHLSSKEYEEIKELIQTEDEVTRDQRLAYERTKIERFYGAELDGNILALDDVGGFRNCYYSYKLATPDENTDHYLIQQQMETNFKTDEFSIIPYPGMKEYFMLKLLNLAGVYEVGCFKNTAIFSTKGLAEFSAYILKHKAQYENLVGKEVPIDISKKPMSTLKSILKQFGLSTSLKTKIQTKGIKTYYYKIDPKKLELMNYWIIKKQTKIS